jgi:hypothetical protein
MMSKGVQSTATNVGSDDVRRAPFVADAEPGGVAHTAERTRPDRGRWRSRRSSSARPSALALEHAAGSLGDEAYLARLKVLRQQRDAVTERTAAGLSAERALEWLRALGESLQAPEKSKEKADVVHAIYGRITVAGPEIVGVRHAGGLRAPLGAGAAQEG